MELIVLLFLFSLIVALGSCKVSGDWAEEEEIDHCNGCAVYSDCNSEDEECPWRCNDGK